MPDEASTKDRLIDAAMRLFCENGYEATGVAAILKEAGVNSGSLYYFFKSKEELLVAVLQKYIELLHPVIIGPAEQRTSHPIERIFALLGLYREFLLQSGCRMGCPIGNLALEISDHHEAARELVRQNFDNWCAAVQKWLEEAGDRLPRSLDRNALARFILTVMEGAQMQAKAEKRIEAFDSSISQLRNYLDSLQALARAGQNG